MKKSGVRKIASVMIVMLLMGIAVLTLSACNEKEGITIKSTTKATYNLYLTTVEYDAASRTITANIHTLGKEKDKLVGVEAAFSSQFYERNMWFNHLSSEYVINPKAIFEALDIAIPPEKRIIDKIKFDNLKVVFRYDTIYKSINSNGNVAKEGKYYGHSLTLDKSETNKIFATERDIQNSANWYSMLISLSIILLIVVFATAIGVKKKNQKNECNKTEENKKTKKITK